MREHSPTKLIDIANICMMILACAVAYKLPREMLVLSYAILGPAHYLTEISWLHDRSYFTQVKRDWIVLVVLSVIAVLLPDGGTFTWISFGIAGAMAFTAREGVRSTIGLLFLLSILVLRKIFGFDLFISVLLPTVTHVYLFTLMFMLYGALKSKSLWGYVSCITMVLCALSFFVYPPTAVIELGDGGRIAAQMVYFEEIGGALLQLLGYTKAENMALAVTGFLAFAYTYHYLNWFSKTRIIRWHQISWRRTQIILVVYLVSLVLYAYDYGIGFTVLLLLSLAHVILEFPLNHKTAVGIAVELKNLLKGKQLAY